jgi:hypothetical protein
MHDALEKAETSRNQHLRELDTRTSHGITVTLFWSPGTDTVSVRVVDEPADETFELEVAREHALDAFHHPYAYAAYRSAPYLVAA